MSEQGKKSGVSANPKRPYAERGGPLLTKAEAADYLAITERQMHRLLGLRLIPKTKIGGLVRVNVADLDAYIEARRVQS